MSLKANYYEWNGLVSAWKTKVLELVQDSAYTLSLLERTLRSYVVMVVSLHKTVH